MIGWLSGRVADKHQPGKLVVDVNGVGYDVETSLPTFFQLESAVGQIELHVHTIVREDALLLYGFIDRQERALFRALIKVNGVGPKMAIAILSSISPNDFIQCIDQQNTALLTKLPGIGKKTAERLLLELKDKLDVTVLPRSGGEHGGDILNALLALGYNDKEASWAAKQLPGGVAVAEGIRQALKLLSKG